MEPSRISDQVESTDLSRSGVWFGAYQLLMRLGKGGMGDVYLARRHDGGGLRRLFAVKVLLESMESDENARAMLVDEARIAARLHHPNCVSVQDIGFIQGRTFIVLDYVDGASLATLIRRTEGRAPIGCLVSVLMDALAGLHAAHNERDEQGRPAGIVHRDVSPDNILVGREGIARITDFGIAKAQERVSTTQTGTFKGKLRYLAPEQLVPKPEIDCRADIFAVGVVLWESLTGECLFRDPSVNRTVYNILHKEVEAPSSVLDSLPTSFDRVCLKALDRDVDGRFESAQAMSDALWAAAGEAGVTVKRSDVVHWLNDLHGFEMSERDRYLQEKSAETSEKDRRVTPSMTGVDATSAPGPDAETVKAGDASAERSPSDPDGNEDASPRRARSGVVRRGYLTRRHLFVALAGIALAVVGGVMLGKARQAAFFRPEAAAPPAARAPAQEAAPEDLEPADESAEPPAFELSPAAGREDAAAQGRVTADKGGAASVGSGRAAPPRAPLPRDVPPRAGSPRAAPSQAVPPRAASPRNVAARAAARRAEPDGAENGARAKQAKGARTSRTTQSTPPADSPSRSPLHQLDSNPYFER